MGDVMQLTVMQKAKAPGSYQDDARITIGAEKPFETSMLAYRPQGSDLLLRLMNLPLATFVPARSAQHIAVRSSGFKENFAVTQMSQVLNAMDECVADLRAMWNVFDSDGLRSEHKQRATANLVDLFKDSDYPVAAAQGRFEGTVKVALLIDETGKLSDCSVVQTTGVALLDAQACALIKKRAKFQPAMGPDGKPAKDALFQRITWRMVP
jgi:TonB family protein